MPRIELLDQQTIDKIAAGEVVDRPASVVKELVENAVDAGADTISVEIRDGGISLIRVTDNGCGIEKDQLTRAFLRHSTSKIRKVEDLFSIHSYGFRGEALSSIAAVSQTELITKTVDSMLGSRYRIEGGTDLGIEEIGAPNGTTVLVRNLFYNTPARRKFLRTPQTEAGYVASLMEHLALSKPEVSFRFVNNGTMKLSTSGNGSLKDVVYSIYGREIAANLVEVNREADGFSVSGLIGKPVISRGNRTYESIFVNGRFIQSKLLAGAVEEGYKGFLMQHRYPFTVLHLAIDGKKVDVNVHPGKMEIRFSEPQAIHEALSAAIHDALQNSQLIRRVSISPKQGMEPESGGKEAEKKRERRAPEPFETARLEKLREAIRESSPYEKKYPERKGPDLFLREGMTEESGKRPDSQAKAEAGSQAKTEPGSLTKAEPDSQAKAEPGSLTKAEPGSPTKAEKEEAGPVEKGKKSRESENEQLTLDLVTGKEERKYYRIIGSLFDTYWLIEYQDELFMIDQHAAHEKVLYERLMKRFAEESFHAQMISPPIILSLSMQEYDRFSRCREAFDRLGFETEPFGDNTVAIRALPADLYGLNGKDLFLELIDDLDEVRAKDTPEMILEKVASMSCKAAVKGNRGLSDPEIRALLDELMQLDNPYFCPHGRPAVIAMTHAEIDKKFGRIL